MSNQEPSRVVHLRLNNSTILGCHKLTELQQGESDIPMSTMLSNVLDSLIDKLIQSGKIPSIEDSAAGVVLNSIYRQSIDEEGDINIQEEPDMFEDFLIDVKVEDETIQENLSIHEVPLEKEFQHRSPDEQQVENNIEYPEVPPWEDPTMTYKYYKELKARAPKDMLIEAAEDSPHLQHCIEIIYEALPIELWGSAKAQALVAEVLPTVEHYLGPLIVNLDGQVLEDK